MHTPKKDGLNMRGENKKPDLTSIMVATHDMRFSPIFWNEFESLAQIKNSKKINLLDLGTGPGLFLRDINKHYPQIFAVGVDESSAMVNYARSLKLPKERIRFYKKDISTKSLNIKGKPFKFITMNFVFHHLPSPLNLMHNLKNGLLAKNGCLIIYDWVRTTLEEYIEFHKLMGREMPEDTAFEMFSEHGKYTSEDLVWLFKREGFKMKEEKAITNLHHLFLFTR